MDVGDWLRELGLERYEEAFRDNEIDARTLPHLTAEDLKEVGVAAIGHRRLLLQAIAALSDQSKVAEAPTEGSRLPIEAPATPIKAAPAAERRQLTVLFCDLVGSTELSAKLDPEDMGAVIRAYQNCCADVIQRWEGHVAKYMGDGVLAYFGWPRAHEDDAERAVRAGLELTGAVGKLATPVREPFAARLGIATGLVMVGERIGEGAAQEEAVVGETPNLAARLEALAEPGSIAIAPGTRRLLGDLFQLSDLGKHQLKGFPEPIRAWAVRGAKAAASRFDSRAGPRLTPLVGREHEIALLLDLWQRAKGGEGQIALISGEPGIGKSRITEILRERLAGEPHVELRYFCSPFHTNSALHPVLDHLQRAAGFARDDPAAVKLEKLEAVLVQGAREVREATSLLAQAMAIPAGGRYPPLNLSPQRQKQRTFEILIDQLEGLAAGQPVLMIFEDAHWIDPSTQELFDLVVERVARLPVLFVITFRPEFSPPWTGHAHVSQLSLNRLSHRQGMAMIERLTGGKALPGEVLRQILDKTDGVPLFVEELTKTVLESGQLEETDDRYILSGPLAAFAIPATLHDSLMERLDRLDLAKEVAQSAACIGREFSHDLLGAVVAVDGDQFQDALDRLVESGLVFRRGTPPEATYTFKHALIQDLAHDSLLRSKRRALHDRIARVLEEKFPETANTTPELLAHHYYEAGLAEDSIPYWHQAGRRTSERSANKEAIAHFTKALQIIGSLPASTERTRLELQLLIALGPILAMTKGYAASEVEKTYVRARALCREAGAPAQFFTVTWGLWFVNHTRLRLETAQTLADELLTLAGQQTDSGFSLQAHHAAWATLECVPDLTACLAHSEQGLALYDQHRHREHKFIYAGHDPGVCSLDTMAMMKWLLGYPDQALERVRRSVELARELAHAASLASALARSSLVYQFRGDIAAARQSAKALISLCAEQGVSPQHLSFGNVVCGWAGVVEGQVASGLAEIRKGLERYGATRIRRRQDYLFGLLADACYRARRLTAGLEAITQALRGSERWWEAELFRLRGELLLAQSTNNRAQAEVCFREALTLAQRQQAKSLELRTLTSLARLWAEQGERQKARDLLAPVYGWFTEGFGTHDLKDAKALLDSLS